MLPTIDAVSTVLIGSLKGGAETFIMPCVVGVQAENFTMLGVYSLQWQAHHSPTSNCIERRGSQNRIFGDGRHSGAGRLRVHILVSSYNWSMFDDRRKHYRKQHWPGID
jgi:hypothetical protein